MNKHFIVAAERAQTLLDAVIRYLSENECAREFVVNYDEADCDGYCLQEDCETALEDLKRAIETEKSNETPKA